MKVNGQLQALVALPPRERAPRAHCIGGWVGSRAGLDAVKYKKKELIACFAFTTKTETAQTKMPRPTVFPLLHMLPNNGRGYTQTHRQQSDLISLLLFYISNESRLEISS
jgi:hypothetical protein